MFARRRRRGLAVVASRTGEIELGVTAGAGTAFALAVRGCRAHRIIVAIIPRRRGPAELEDVNRVCSGGNAEEGGGGVERHAVDAGRQGSTAELVKFAGRRDREDTDDGAFVGCGGEEGAGVVDGDTGEG